MSNRSTIVVSLLFGGSAIGSAVWEMFGLVPAILVGLVVATLVSIRLVEPKVVRRMSRAEILERWKRDKSVIAHSSLRLLSTTGEGSWYECPCGGDHAAWRPMETLWGDGEHAVSRAPADILSCYFTDQQWFITPVDAAQVIMDEEKAYIDLLDRSEATVRKVTAKRGYGSDVVAFLHDTHGIPENIAEEIITRLQSTENDK